MAEQICYLCGLPGADSREHVIPDCLFFQGTAAYPDRITAPAHKGCNGAYSKDEAYLRDLLAFEASADPGGEEILAKARRAAARPEGQKWYEELLAQTRPAEVRTPSGIILGTARALSPDRDRVNRVGRKIARGLLFVDLNTVHEDKAVQCDFMKVTNFAIEMANPIAHQSLAWMALCHPACLHVEFSGGIAVRRIYFRQIRRGEGKNLPWHFSGAICLYSSVFVVLAALTVKEIPTKLHQAVFEQ